MQLWNTKDDLLPTYIWQWESPRPICLADSANFNRYGWRERLLQKRFEKRHPWIPVSKKRLLDFILQVSSEILPEPPPESVSGDLVPGSRLFQPLLDPDDSHFREKMKVDVHDIVRARNMHSKKHTPTCFKYGKRHCRARFPRKLVPETRFDPNLY